MSALNLKETLIHEQALKLASGHRLLESEIVKSIQDVEHLGIHKKLGFSSLYKYVKSLGYSDYITYSFIAVARQARLYPEVAAAVLKSEVSISTLYKIVPALSSQSAGELISFARSHTSQEIEREVVRRNPRAKTKSQAKYLAHDIVELRVTLSHAGFEQFKKAQDLESQRTKTSVSLDETLSNILEFYLKHKDPALKAERAQVRVELKAQKEALEEVEMEAQRKMQKNGQKKAKEEAQKKTEEESQEETQKKMQEERWEKTQKMGQGETWEGAQDKAQEVRLLAREVSFKGEETNESAEMTGHRRTSLRRKPLTAQQKHTVVRRDGNQCTYIEHGGNRCTNRRWLEIHHIRPVSQGGNNELKNLATLCSNHHDLCHQTVFPIEGAITQLRAPERIYRALA